MKDCIHRNLANQMPPPLCQVNVARNVKTRIRGDMDKEQAVETTGQSTLVPVGSLYQGDLLDIPSAYLPA